MITALEWFLNIKNSSNNLYDSKKKIYSFNISDVEEPIIENFFPNIVSRRPLSFYDKKSVIFESLHSIVNESRHVAKFLEPLADEVIKIAQHMTLQGIENRKFINDDIIELCIKDRPNIKKFALSVMIDRNQEDLATAAKVSSDENEFVVIINPILFRDPRDVKSFIIHELVHVIDMSSSNVLVPYGLSNNEDFTVFDFLYTFSPKEINARMTEVWYAFKENLYSKKEIKNLIKLLNQRLEDFYKYNSIIQIDHSKPSNDIDKYWYLITMYDKMMFYLKTLSELSVKEKSKFISGLFSKSEEYEDLIEQYDDIRPKKFKTEYKLENKEKNIEILNAFFGISKSFSDDKNIKRILNKCRTIFKKYSQKLEIILKDLEREARM